MSGNGDFDSFVDWTHTIVSHAEFAAEERNYKVELSDKFGELRRSGLTGESVLGWLRDPSNNVVRWNTPDTLSKKVDPADVAAATERLLAEGDLGQRIEEFAEWLHRAADCAAGEQATVASALLMGLDATQFPPYKTRAINHCMELAGRQGSKGPAAERYLEFLTFCDELVEALDIRHGMAADRLDVQGACWMIGSWSPEDMERFLPERHREFERWRGNNSTPQAPDDALTWWVNQGATYRQERDGSYIWAPQVTKSGNTVAHHKAVFAVRTGDRIIHYANGHVRAIGTATSDGREADRPSDLPDDAWEQAGFRADVNYQEMNEPLPLSAIDSALRSGAGGPFNSSGGVNQGYLYPIPESIREHLAGLLLGSAPTPEPPPTSSRAWVVYVGKATESNLEFSLPLGRWGWKQSQDYYEQLQPGDTFIFATRYSDGSPRVSAEDWAAHGVGRVLNCRTTSAIYEDAEPFWPDETEDVTYPFRVDLDLVDDAGESSSAAIDKRFGGPISEAIRLSAINQGRAELVELAGPPPAPKPFAFDEVVDSFIEATRSHGLDYGTRHENLVRSFVTALATKPFVILTGLSGSGKTRLAQAFGDWVGASCVVAVRPDWTSPDSLLGFENALSAPIDGRYAWNVPETLEFILQARDNPTQPHVLLLDEMNLAHVERYFADVLSGMESEEAVVPDLVRDAEGVYRSRSSVGGKVALPENLFVVGTVNIDETTYMFSPKVLDRANTFEFRVETEDLITTAKPAKLAPAPPGASAGFLAAAIDETLGIDETLAEWMRGVHRLLADSDREFGHRTFQEALRFAALLERAGETDPLIALDLQIAQKVLPRLHGSRRELSQLLDQFGGFCFAGPNGSTPADFESAAELPAGSVAALPISFDKLHRMAKRLSDNHFVSFAE